MTAVKQYKIGGATEAESLGKASEDNLEDGIRKFMDLSSNKRPSNDTRKKQ